MNQRHHTSRNKIVIPASEYRGTYRLKGNHPMIRGYLEQIENVMHRTMARYGRVTMIRVDLRFPKWWDLEVYPYQSCIKEFNSNLLGLLMHRNSERAHPTLPRFVWCREFGDKNGRPHYHLAIMVSGHAYFPQKFYDVSSTHNIGGLITQAWLDTLGLWYEEGKGLAFLPEDGTCSFSSGDPNSLIGAFRQLSYIAKVRTKRYGDGFRNFGYSLK